MRYKTPYAFITTFNREGYTPFIVLILKLFFVLFYCYGSFFDKILLINNMQTAFAAFSYGGKTVYPKRFPRVRFRRYFFVFSA